MKKRSLMVVLVALIAVVAFAQSGGAPDLDVVDITKEMNYTGDVCDGKIRFKVKNNGGDYLGSIITEIDFVEYARIPVKLKHGESRKIEFPLPADHYAKSMFTIYANGEGTPILYNDIKGTKANANISIKNLNVGSNKVVKGDTLLTKVEVNNQDEAIDIKTVVKVVYFTDQDERLHTTVIHLDLPHGMLYTNTLKYTPSEDLKSTRVKTRMFFYRQDASTAQVSEDYVTFPSKD